MGGRKKETDKKYMNWTAWVRDKDQSKFINYFVQSSLWRIAQILSFINIIRSLYWNAFCAAVLKLADPICEERFRLLTTPRKHRVLNATVTGKSPSTQDFLVVETCDIRWKQVGMVRCVGEVEITAAWWLQR